MHFQWTTHPSFLMIFAILAMCSCTKTDSPSYLQTAEDLLWKDPDSCLVFLDSLEQELLSEHDAHVFELMHEHANFKINHVLEDDNALFVLKEYFESINDYRHAGETNYIIGRNLVVHQNSPLGTFYLKAAEENLLEIKDAPSRILGLIYYSLGDCAEQDRLFEIANEYYKKALPLFIASGDSLYISCTYRDIAKTDTGFTAISLAQLDTALLMTPKSVGYEYSLQIEANKYLYFLRTDSITAIKDYHILCDSLNLYIYANNLTDYYLSKHDLEQAYHYLTLSALDTANSYWSLEHYLFNKATYLSEIGLKDSAIAVLQDLHLRQTEEIESSAFTRSYMVEQRYDAERERSAKLQAQAEKRQALLLLLLIAAALLIIIAGLLFLWWREVINKQHKKEQMQHIAEQMQLKQKYLQEKLQQRVAISAKLRKYDTKHEKFTEATYKRLISELVFLDPKQWEQLLRDYDQAYAGFLSHLTGMYHLTETDQIYIALITLGCSVEDICLLTQTNPQSVWNRKSILKQHLQIEDITSIDDRLQELAQAFGKSGNTNLRDGIIFVEKREKSTISDE